MSKYTTYYRINRLKYRELAMNWQKFVENAEDLHFTVQHKKGMELFFKSIAKRFGLTKEFRDIGVI